MKLCVWIELAPNGCLLQVLVRVGSRIYFSKWKRIFPPIGEITDPAQIGMVDRAPIDV